MNTKTLKHREPLRTSQVQQEGRKVQSASESVGWANFNRLTLYGEINEGNYRQDSRGSFLKLTRSYPSHNLPNSCNCLKNFTRVKCTRYVTCTTKHAKMVLSLLSKNSLPQTSVNASNELNLLCPFTLADKGHSNSTVKEQWKEAMQLPFKGTANYPVRRSLNAFTRNVWPNAKLKLMAKVYVTENKIYIYIQIYVGKKRRSPWRHPSTRANNKRRQQQRRRRRRRQKIWEYSKLLEAGQAMADWDEKTTGNFGKCKQKTTKKALICSSSDV